LGYSQTKTEIFKKEISINTLLKGFVHPIKNKKKLLSFAGSGPTDRNGNQRM
jgi:hypothetical protein